MICNSAPRNLSVTVLLDLGYSISLENGQLIIKVNNNVPLAKQLIDTHTWKLMVEILQKIGCDALSYLSYSARPYGKIRASGVTLQFKHVLTGAEAYAIFNAGLTRSRNTKHGRVGDPLPKGQFHVAKGSGFCKFWASTGLPSRRLSSYYEYMGKLKLFFFESQDISSSNNRLNSSSLKTLHISCHEVKAAFGLAGNVPTINRQCTDKQPTLTTDKEVPQRAKTLGLQADSAKGSIYYGNTVIREKVTRGNIYPINDMDNTISSIPIYEYEDPEIREFIIDIVLAELEEQGSYKPGLI
jgi:hypothetical protein